MVPVGGAGAAGPAAQGRAVAGGAGLRALAGAAALGGGARRHARRRPGCCCRGRCSTSPRPSSGRAGAGSAERGPAMSRIDRRSAAARGRRRAGGAGAAAPGLGRGLGGVGRLDPRRLRARRGQRLRRRRPRRRRRRCSKGTTPAPAGRRPRSPRSSPRSTRSRRSAPATASAPACWRRGRSRAGRCAATWCSRAAATRCSTPTGSARLVAALQDARASSASRAGSWSPTARCPSCADVARDQPEDAGYNPTLSGLNLNFNRVQMSWAPEQAPVFGAPGAKLVVPVAGIGGAVGKGPIRHRFEDGREVWSLPAGRVNGRGSDWLPVRAPAPYAGEVFAGLAAQAGLTLPAAEVVAARRRRRARDQRQPGARPHAARHAALFDQPHRRGDRAPRQPGARRGARRRRRLGGGDGRLGAAALRAAGGVLRRPFGPRRRLAGGAGGDGGGAAPGRRARRAAQAAAGEGRGRRAGGPRGRGGGEDRHAVLRLRRSPAT